MVQISEMEFALTICCSCCCLGVVAVVTAIPFVLSALSLSNLLHIRKEANWGVLEFLMIVDVIVCAYYALSLISACFSSRPKIKAMSILPGLLAELILTGLMFSACLVTIHKVYMDTHSPEHIAYQDLCGRLPSFCHRIAISVALSSSACAVSFILIIFEAAACCCLCIAAENDDEMC